MIWTRLPEWRTRAAQIVDADRNRLVFEEGECLVMSPVDPLVECLAAEVAATTERIHSLQTEAARVFLGQEQRFMRFVALSDHDLNLFKTAREMS